MSDKTIPKLLMQNSVDFGNKVAMRKKHLGIWKHYTWKEYYDNVKYFGLGMLVLGMNRGDRVCMIGDNGPEWYWADIAAGALGGVPLGIYSDCIVSEIKYIMEDSGARFAVARDQEQVDKLLSLTESLPFLEKIIYWDDKGLWSYRNPEIISFAEVQKLGLEYEEHNKEAFKNHVEATCPEDICFLAYTSGTTGLPKGAIVSHRNLLAFANCSFRQYPAYLSREYVSQIAPAWLAEQWYGLACPLLGGTTINFPEGPDTAQIDLREIAPNMVAAPPRAWEMIASRVQALMMDANFIKRWVYTLAIRISLRKTNIQARGKHHNLFWRALNGLAYLAVFRPIRDKLGLIHVRVAFTSGGFLAPNVFRYLAALGLNLKQAYATTEAGLICIHRNDDVDYETVGQLIPGGELRLGVNGEIMVRSDMSVSGYWQGPNGVHERFTGGWVKTGDAGYFKEDGHFVVIDRLSDMTDLPNGGKFSPSYIEGRLRFSPYIREVMVVGGGQRSYVAAIVSIDFETVSRWADRTHVIYSTLADLSQKQEVYDLMRSEIMGINSNLPQNNQVMRFVNLHKELDADDAELTRTKKLRRDYAAKLYSGLITALYSDDKECNMQTEVKYRDGRTKLVTTRIKIESVS